MQTYFIQDYLNTSTMRKDNFCVFNLSTRRENVLYSNDLKNNNHPVVEEVLDPLLIK